MHLVKFITHKASKYFKFLSMFIEFGYACKKPPPGGPVPVIAARATSEVTITPPYFRHKGLLCRLDFSCS